MASLRSALEQRLLKAFAPHYDIDAVDDGSSLKAACAFHSRDSQYVLSKKVELWAAEHHEYLYLFSLPRLNEAAVEEIVQKTLELGTPQVKPHAQHMYTYLTAVVLCDQTDEQALRVLQKKKHRREFKLSLHGWMEFRIAAVDLSTDVISTNRAGREFKKSLRPFVEAAKKSIIGEENPK